MNRPTRAPFDPPSRHGGDDLLRMRATGLLEKGGPFERIRGEVLDVPAEGDAHLNLTAALNRFVHALPEDVGLVPDGAQRPIETDWPEPDFARSSRRGVRVAGSGSGASVRLADFLRR